jgi:hypothetical protein
MSKTQLYILTTTLILFNIYIGFSQDTISTTDVRSEIKQPLTPEQQEKVNSAVVAMEAVQKAGAYIESISDLLQNKEITLPVGIKKGGYELIIQKIKHNKKTGKANIYATCAVKLKDDGQVVAFEGMADIEGQNGLGTNGSLELIAPVWRDLGKHASLGFIDGTKVLFGCEGIELFDAQMLFAVTSEKIYEVGSDGKPTGKPFMASFNALFTDFEDYTVSLDVSKSFAIKGLPDVFFNIHGATVDQSDVETSKMVVFPEGYFSGAQQNDILLWKGLAFTGATMSLPGFFKPPTENDTLHPGQSTRVEIGVKNSVFDENGFTAQVVAENVIPSQVLDKTKWDVSLNDLSLLIMKNEVTGFGFGGDINIPPLGKNSLLAYDALYNPVSKEYDFWVEVDGDYDFPALMSTLTLNQNSMLEIKLKDSKFYPALYANGMITVNAPLNKEDSTQKFSVPDISFENMVISREEPYFSVGAIGVAGKLKTPKVAGFELYVEEIMPFTDDKGTGLSFDAGVKLNDMFGGEAGILLYGNYKTWQFDHVGLSKINVDFKSKAFSLYGGVMFKNGDKVYGNGFRGDLTFNLIDKFELAAVGVFGKKDDYRYFLTDVFFETSPLQGIQATPLVFYGFGGGVYRRMQQTIDPDIDPVFAKSLSGMVYVPDNEVGMGFMASTKFCLGGSPKAFNSLVTFEMQFNKYGGVNFIQLRGDASCMDLPDKWAKLSEDIVDKVNKVEAMDGKMKIATKDDLKVPENKSSGFLTASLNVKFDIANKVFSADLNTYLNAGLIRGVGENDRMGWASAYFSENKWYTYMGTPSDRLGIELLGLARADAYFMLGHDIPPMPPPPKKVLKNFSLDKQKQLDTRDNSDLATGKGIALGASLSVGFDATVPPFYASIGAGLGADLMLKHLGEGVYCENRTGTVGINGWYAEAQAWAWVEADIGMEAKMFGSTNRFSILDISASALLKGAGPNPMYLSGAVGGSFDLMGGLVSGHCDFDFEIGDECRLKGASVFSEQIIAQLTPASGDKDVNVFTAPQAVFNIPIGLEMEIEEGNGEKVMYKVTLEKFDVYYKDTKAKIQGHQEMSTDALVCALDPSEPFESNKEIVVYAKVGFKRRVNGHWGYVTENGKPVYEEKSESFLSGERPKIIMPEHVKYSYPMPRQYNFYPDEHETGYILVSENYAYLFSSEKPEGFDQVVRVSDKNGSSWEVPFTYETKSAGNDIRLEIDFPMAEMAYTNNDIYKVALVNVPKDNSFDVKGNVSSVSSTMEGQDSISVTIQEAEGAIQNLREKEIYAHHFRTSKYNTFDEKIAQYDTRGTGWRDFVSAFIHDIKANITDDEYFDLYEMQWFNGDMPAVRFEAGLEGTRWFTKSIYDEMYAYHSGTSIKDERVNFDPKLEEYGFPPVGAVEIQNTEDDNLLSEDEIKTGVPVTTNPYGIFAYRLPYYCARDFVFIKNEIGKKAARKEPLSKVEQEILATDFPPTVTKGDYPLKIKYMLPGKEVATSEINIKMYNPID